jgi:outer membrane usher protein
VRVDFGLRESRTALLILHDSDNRPLPVGSLVMRDGQPLAVVGFDGQSYLENLGSRNRITVVPGEQAECVVRFDYPAASTGIPMIGPLRCVP